MVAAFKRFQARHPDALLVTAWHSPWPAHAGGIAKSPHVKGPPAMVDGKLDISGWLVANGLGADALHRRRHLERTPICAACLRDMDLALMPSRCEGGTNLVAMECMASGVPVILSRNTGHLDLIAKDNCYSLDFQIPMGEVTGRADLDGWGESSIDEMAAKLEAAYADRDAAASAGGAAAAAFMQGWGWPAQIGRLLEAIADVRLPSADLLVMAAVKSRAKRGPSQIGEACDPSRKPGSQSRQPRRVRPRERRAMSSNPRRSFANQFRQSRMGEVARRMAAGEGRAGKRHDRAAHPQGFAGGQAAGIWESVEGDVDGVIGIEEFPVRRASGDDDAVRRDAVSSE